MEQPTLSEVRSWPATCSVAQAAAALGVSRAHAYGQIRTGNFPVRTLAVGGKIRVITADLLAVLAPAGRAA